MKNNNLCGSSSTAKNAFFILCIVCAVLFLVDFPFHRHGHIEIEEWPGFYAVYGFISCVLIVFISKYILRPLVMRSEDYYDN